MSLVRCRDWVALASYNAIFGSLTEVEIGPAMCLLYLFVNPKPKPDEYLLVLANVRDEFFGRPTSGCHIWERNPQLVGRKCKSIHISQRNSLVWDRTSYWWRYHFLVAFYYSLLAGMQKLSPQSWIWVLRNCVSIYRHSFFVTFWKLNIIFTEIHSSTDTYVNETSLRESPDLVQVGVRDHRRNADASIYPKHHGKLCDEVSIISGSPEQLFKVILWRLSRTSTFIKFSLVFVFYMLRCAMDLLRESLSLQRPYPTVRKLTRWTVWMPQLLVKFFILILAIWRRWRVRMEWA